MTPDRIIGITLLIGAVLWVGFTIKIVVKKTLRKRDE